MKLTLRFMAPFFVRLVIYLIPAPRGLNANQWQYFAVFAGVITGLILESMPEVEVKPRHHQPQLQNSVSTIPQRDAETAAAYGKRVAEVAAKLKA